MNLPSNNVLMDIKLMQKNNAVATITLYFVETCGTTVKTVTVASHMYIKAKKLKYMDEAVARRGSPYGLKEGKLV